MGFLDRALRNTYRKAVRSGVVVIILGFALCVFLTMSIVSSDVSGGLTHVAQLADNGITVRPAGSFGGFGGGGAKTMNESMASEIRGDPNVASVQELLTHTNGSFSFGSGHFPTFIEGEDPSQPLILISGGSLTITSGRSLFAGDASSDVAIVGTNYSSTYSVGTGGTISLNGTTVSVVGTFSTGYSFGDNSVIMPLGPMQKIYGISGISEVYVTVNSVGNVASVVTEIQNQIGSNYDVVSNAQEAQTLQSSLNSIVSSTQTALVISVVTAIAVIVFLMILITRERTQEIGVLKAIGFSSSNITAQFLTESIVLAVLGFVVSIGLTLEFGPQLANSVLGSSSSGGAGGFRGGGAFLFAKVSFTLSPELALTALLLAVGIGVIGALYPILRAVTLKPAEALRYE